MFWGTCFFLFDRFGAWGLKFAGIVVADVQLPRSSTLPFMFFNKTQLVPFLADGPRYVNPKL